MSGPVANFFSWPVRVYWEDTDAGGIVYYANYLKFMERARSEWLRALGIEQGPLQRDHGLMFVVVDAASHFQRPARYGDLLHVSCEIEKWTKVSLTFRQEITRTTEASDRELLVTGTVRVACLDATKFRPRALPDSLVQQMTVSGES
ncbi:acyl-CoA thioester hydrolase [Povalibacter uvarum]|uniref:Acyl-CoA thioester hydrolase n=1 Tax=Povalibacter uvarum TaxID=732238 RepID=A0A841HHR2_9GAMM|nr:tol-pal system-associated acyl-CoA thioesterase [Povalibacter uvarum]MBB6092223.1 acyl-CoA thioester hydrolase [Povalibacter uvarum]